MKHILTLAIMVGLITVATAGYEKYQDPVNDKIESDWNEYKGNEKAGDTDPKVIALMEGAISSKCEMLDVGVFKCGNLTVASASLMHITTTTTTTMKTTTTTLKKKGCCEKGRCVDSPLCKVYNCDSNDECKSVIEP